MTPDAPPPAVPGYVVDRLLGEGGMGQVWHGRRATDSLDVAIKVILPDRLEAGNRKELMKRFRREMAVCATFAHPNLLKALDGGVLADGETPYLVTEYLRGFPLNVHPEFGRFSEGLCLDLASQVVEAFAYYHPKGLLHRDIKPANVFLTEDGRVVLLDFGLAFDTGRTRITATGVVAGTPCCLAPEQLLAKPLGPATDVFQLGVLLYASLVENVPYSPAAMVDFATGGSCEPPAPPDVLRPGLSSPLSQLVLGCLDLEPALRWQGADDLREAVEAVRRGEVPRKAPPSLPRPAPISAAASAASRSPGAGRPQVLALGALLALAVVGGGAWLLRRDLRPARPAPAGLAVVQRELAQEVPVLRAQLLDGPPIPEPAETRVLGELLEASGERARAGLPALPDPAALGLFYVGRAALGELDPVRRARAFGFLDLCLSRHGLPGDPAAATVLLESAARSATTTAERSGFIARLRDLRRRAVAPACEALVASRLARALLDGYGRRHPDDGLLLREFQGFMFIPRGDDPALDEVSSLLEPLVMGFVEPPPLAESALTYFEMLHTVRTNASKRVGLEALAALGRKGRFADPSLVPAFLVAASLAQLRAADHEPAVMEELSRRALPDLRALAAAWQGTSQGALLQLYLTLVVFRLGPPSAAEEALRQVRLADVAPDARWRYWWVAADVWRSTRGVEEAKRAFAAARDAAPTRQVREHFVLRLKGFQLEDNLFPLRGR